MENLKKTNLLDWQTGKVQGFNARNLLELKNGSLKMVKVDYLAEYPTHLHPNKTEYAYVLEGKPVIKIGEIEYKGVKGDFFTFPKNIKHSIGNPHNSECLLLIGGINN